MGATPSFAAQQTAYLEVLDQCIDYDGEENLRKCLLDENGNQLRDAEGNLKTLRHRFAIYCDDIAAGADTLDELYELLEALLCCCYKAGIQVKAGKVKFGVPEVIFHSYTISKKGSECMCFRQDGGTKTHASVKGILRMLSTVKPVHQGLRDHREALTQHH